MSNQERRALFGTRADWERYAEALSEYRVEGDASSPKIKDFANALDEHGRITIDAQGALWLDYQDGDTSRRVGISASNVNASESDGELAHSLMLARTSAVLASAPKNREMLPEFRANWLLLEDAHRNLESKALAQQSVPSNADAPASTAEPILSFGSALFP
jgi:secreted PhoX family phosphatase